MKSWLLNVLTVATMVVLLGCGGGTNPPPAPDPGQTGTGNDSDVLQVGDLLRITFSGPIDPIPPHEERIPPSGEITLPHIGKIKAVDVTRVELQDRIRTNYIPAIYRDITITIAPAERFFTVRGQVNDPNRHPYLGELTVLQAIGAAGDFTPFANKRRVEVTRKDGTRIIVNCDKAQQDPRLDIEILPGDTIFVDRSWFN